jgi:co-chaperonin GroES (HSP10)
VIEPMNDYILVERLPEPEQKGRIIIPDVAQEKGIKGKVLAVGPGKWIEGINGGRVRRTPEVKPGDFVLFNSKWNDFAGDHYDDLPIGSDPRLHLVQEADVFLKIQGGRD